jgi:Escherichia/Staphylococcus phage prohead protease
MDMVIPGAFTDSLIKRPAAKVKMLWQRRSDDIRGVWTELREDQRGFYCKGRLLLNLEKGKEAHELMKEGALDGLSIGYRTEKYEIDENLGVRKLMNVELFEVSLVTFPMNDNSLINRVKADNLPTIREFEQWLARDAGFSVQQAKAIVADGYKSLMNARDAGMSDEGGLAKALQEATQRMRG